MDKSKILLEAIDKYVHPYTLPVAVKLAREDCDMPGFVSPLKELGHKIGVCQALALVRRLGWCIKYSAEEHVCPGSFLMFGYNEMPDMCEEGGGLHYPVYASSREAGKKTHVEVPLLEEGFLDSLYIAPLKRAAFEPDVIITYGQAAQIARFIQAVVYTEGGVIESKFMGRGACGASIITPFVKQKCNVAIPGGGERLFALTDDTELLFAVPGNMFETVAIGLEQTHKKGVAKIPTPFFGMMGEPRFPQPYGEVAKTFKKEFPIKC